MLPEGYRERQDQARAYGMFIHELYEILFDNDIIPTKYDS